MFITNTGRLHWLKGYKIPEGSRQSKGKPIVNMLPDLEDGEKVVNTISVSEFTDDKALVFCTKSGIIKKTILSAYGNIRSRGIKAIKLEEGDELISTGITDDTNEIVIATKHGQAARFDEFEVRATGRDTMGVKGITLSGDDEVVGMTIVKPEDMILSVSENGFGKISVVDEYRKTHRGSKGVITMKTTERNGSVVAISKVCMDDELMVTSKQGKMIRIKVSEIRVTGRNAAGVKIMDMRNDDKIIALQAISSVRDDDEIEEPDA